MVFQRPNSPYQGVGLPLTCPPTNPGWLGNIGDSIARQAPEHRGDTTVRLPHRLSAQGDISPSVNLKTKFTTIATENKVSWSSVDSFACAPRRAMQSIV